ncbi:MAG TPA: cyclic nucleotide-binding domain-containing protein [Methylocella sp.]|nr:cyclic nucleotide-binding domain-containing protein [Methylocella sp.]
MPENFLGLFDGETDTVTLEPGQTLFEKGEAGRHMYVVKSGELQILVGNHSFESVPAGGLVGEMALISELPRSAAARAVTRSVVIPVDQKRFTILVQQAPFFAIRVMRVMSDRLKAMNERVTSLPDE